MNQLTHAENTPIHWWARLILGFVALNAFVGAAILTLLPDQTERFFFWPIKPAINAALFGALYLGGATAVAFAVWRNEWESARYLTPILVAAGILISLVTLLHLDRFTPGIRLVYWLVVYIGAPLLALLIYAAQERQGSNWTVTEPVRPLTRTIALLTGGGVLLLGLSLIVWPQTAVVAWPWPTTTLMVRIFAAWFGAFGVGLLWFGIERDWRRLIGIPNLMMVSAGLDLLMLFLHRQEVTGSGLSLWFYGGHLALFGLLGGWLHWLQRQPQMTTNSLKKKEFLS